MVAKNEDSYDDEPEDKYSIDKVITAMETMVLPISDQTQIIDKLLNNTGDQEIRGAENKTERGMLESEVKANTYM
jgi:hypothetical protein